MMSSPRLRLERLEERLTLDGSAAIAQIVLAPPSMPTDMTMVTAPPSAPIGVVVMPMSMNMTTAPDSYPATSSVYVMPTSTESPPPLMADSAISIGNQLAAQAAWVSFSPTTIYNMPGFMPSPGGDGTGLGTGTGGGSLSI